MFFQPAADNHLLKLHTDNSKRFWDHMADSKKPPDADYTGYSHKYGKQENKTDGQIE